MPVYPICGQHYNGRDARGKIKMQISGGRPRKTVQDILNINGRCKILGPVPSRIAFAVPNSLCKYICACVDSRTYLIRSGMRCTRYTNRGGENRKHPVSGRRRTMRRGRIFAHPVFLGGMNNARVGVSSGCARIVYHFFPRNVLGKIWTTR